MSLQLEPKRSKKTIEEEVLELKAENQQLRETISRLKTEDKQRLIAQQTMLEKIQQSDSKASATVRTILSSISEGTSSAEEQIILLKLELQAALDLCIAMESQPKHVPSKKK